MPQIDDPDGRERIHLRQIVNFSGARVLEIGCGDGRLTHTYADLTTNITGIDLKHDPLITAREKHPRLNFLEASAITMPFPDDTFDIVVFAWSY